MGKKARVWDGTAWQELASAQTDLTAYSTTAQMNTAITAGVGLVPILTQTIGTAVSSITVANAFSATYDAYKIMISGGSGSTGASIQLKLGASTTTYNYVYFGVNNSGTADIGRGTSVSSFPESGACNNSIISLNIDLVNPFLAKYTQVISPYLGAGTNGLIQIGWHGTASSYTDFTLTTSGGTLTGGTIRVYGYKN